MDLLIHTILNDLTINYIRGNMGTIGGLLMPIEQVQQLLGHTKIDTTLHYAKVNQANVKVSHHRFIC